MTLPVFLVDALPAGESTVLAGAEGRHAASVRRLRAGERLLLTDGRGNAAECVIASVDRDSLALNVIRRSTEPPAQPKVILAQALVKGDRGELAVELATEAGVDAVLPWRAARCVARWDEGPRGAKALARWRSTAREAAKQSRRLWLPPVAAPVSTAELAKTVAAVGKALILHESAEQSIVDTSLPSSGELLLIVGPEGGIADDELATLSGAGALPVRLGKTVLRASTAAAVAIGALGVLTDRWR